jgi:hypothetical protein
VITIYKYELPTLPGIYTERLPPGRVLSVGTAPNANGYMIPVMWAEVNTDAPDRDVHIMVAWTGSLTPDILTHNWRFLGTVVYDEGRMVMVQHVYVRE